MSNKRAYFTIDDIELFFEYSILSYNEDLLFVCIDENDQRYLASVVNADDMYGFYIVGKIDNVSIIKMLQNKLTLRQVFDEMSKIILFDYRNSNEISSDILKDKSLLPFEGVMLNVSEDLEVLNYIDQIILSDTAKRISEIEPMPITWLKKKMKSFSFKNETKYYSKNKVLNSISSESYKISIVEFKTVDLKKIKSQSYYFEISHINPIIKETESKLIIDSSENGNWMRPQSDFRVFNFFGSEPKETKLTYGIN